MKQILATTAIAALLALPAAAQDVTTQPDTGIGAGADVGAGAGIGATPGGVATEGEIRPDIGAGDVASETEIRPPETTAGTEVAPGASTDTAAAGSATFPMDAETYLASGNGADVLNGQRVYDANDEWIGEIDEIVTGPDGSSQAIVHVGGFLGLGEKPVALSLADLQIVEEPTDTAQADAMTTPSEPGIAAGEPAPEAAPSIKVTVQMTKEQLEEMPDYEG